MLGTKSKSKNEPLSTSRTVTRGDSSASCVITQGTKIKGNFRSNENIRLDGEVNGEVKCEQKLVIGEQGVVNGKVFAKESVILGKVEGNVAVSGTLHLHSSASILGDITTKFLIVDEGAKYNGACKVGN